MRAQINYASPGPLTTLEDIDPEILGSSSDPVDVVWPVHELVLQPGDAEQLGLPPDRLLENQFRPASRLVGAILNLDASPLSTPREPAKRVVGTCRHFAVQACALLRYRGIPARVRCGFATYFRAPKALDHWIIEYRDEVGGRWIRLDPEILGPDPLGRPFDLRGCFRCRAQPAS